MSSLQPLQPPEDMLYDASENGNMDEGRTLIPFFLDNDERNVEMSTSSRAKGIGAPTNNDDAISDEEEYDEEEDEFDFDMGMTLDCLIGPTTTPKTKPEKKTKKPTLPSTKEPTLPSTSLPRKNGQPVKTAASSIALTPEMLANDSGQQSSEKFAWASFQTAPEARELPLPSWVAHLPKEKKVVQKKGRNRKKKDNNKIKNETQNGVQIQKKTKKGKKQASEQIQILKPAHPQIQIVKPAHPPSSPQTANQLENMSKGLMGMLRIGETASPPPAPPAPPQKRQSATSTIKSLLGIGGL